MAPFQALSKEFKNLLFLLKLSIFLAPQAFASLDWFYDNPTIPQCPKQGPELLPNTYPAIAYVVSDRPFISKSNPSKKEGYEFTLEFIKSVFENSGDRIPYIILPVQKKTFELAKDYIQSRTVGLNSPRLKKAWEDSLIFVDNPSVRYTWQQDYFHSFFDILTGLPILRPILGYRAISKNEDDPLNKSDKFESREMVGNLLSKISFLKRGPTIPSFHSLSHVATSAYSGGNLQGFPGGLCLHGDNLDFLPYRIDACGRDIDELTIPTSWLDVRHVDEIVGVTRDKTKNFPCDFAITVASYDKAVQLLRENPDELFTEYYRYPQAEKFMPLRYICEAYLIRMEDSQSNTPFNQHDCKNLTNKQVLQIIENDYELPLQNSYAQKQLEKVKQIILAKLKQRLPQCSPKVIEAPEIFYSEKDWLENEIPNKPKLTAVLPNQANLVQTENAVLAPKSGNKAFSDYMRSEYNQIGQDYKEVDTFLYSHLGDGNLHCVTNALRACRPSK